MEHPTNFTNALKKLIEIGRLIIAVLPYDREKVPPYWIRCFEKISSSILQKIVSDYEKNNVVEEERFAGLRGEFQNLYMLYSDVFSSDIISKVDGKTEVRDEWIRISKEELGEDLEETDVERTDIYSGLSANRGLSICIRKKEIGSKGVDIEFPLSEMFEAGIVCLKSGFKKPKFPLAIIYAICACIKFSGVRYHEKIDETMEKLLPSTEKEGNALDSQIKKAKRYVKPLVDQNKDILSGLIDQVTDGIDDIDPDQIEEIATEAQKHISAINKTQGGSFTDMMKSFLPGSANVEEKLDEYGINTDTLRSMVDRHMDGDGMSNEELLSSIPELEKLIQDSKK